MMGATIRGNCPRRVLALAMVVAALLVIPGSTSADDRADFTTTYYFENRRGGLGGLQVIHPQFDVGVDIGEHVSLAAGYSADVVSGATSAVYSVDAVSTATEFDDVRHEGRLSLGFKGSRSSLIMSAGVGTERDYSSITVGASGTIDLPGRNTSLSLSYTHNFDEVCDRDNGMLGILERKPLTGVDPCEKENGLFGTDAFDIVGTRITTWRDIAIDTVQASLTQNLTPTTNVQVSLYGQVIDGFQSNPYRRVRVGGNEAQEASPDVRGRLALMVRANRYLRPLRSAVHAALRGYSDTWGVSSATVELAYSQYLGKSLIARFRSRYYQQTSATFFKDALLYQTESTAGSFFSGDRELAALRNILVGANLSLLSVAEDDRQVWGVFDKLQFNLKADILFLDEDVGDDQFLSSGQLLDVIVLQLGVLLSY
ncbi:MAG: DUF3570 domain-containing protein [Proteobacteria bacterium]|nr:DUF3570 domain-containing protein [Pseudomonadota bacterium]